MTKVLVDPEIASLCPALTDKEHSLLEASLLAEGCRDALVVWNEILLDGHNRYEICTKHGIEFETSELDGIPTRKDAKAWVLRNQLGRRNLSTYQKAEIALQLKPLIAEQAKGRMLAGKVDPDQKSGQGKTDRDLASIAGVSHDTIHKAEYISTHVDDDTKDRLRRGDSTINREYTRVRRDAKKKKLEEEKKRQAQQIKKSPNPPVVELGDYGAWLEKQSQCDLLLTDPPYSTDVDDIQTFASSLLFMALDKVKPTGRAYVFIGAYPEEIQAYLKARMPDQILVWTYRNTLGPSPKDKYKLNWQAILYYKMAEAQALDCPVMTEQFSVQDINAPDGRQGDRYHKWQKPDEIAERFIKHATKEGDIVLDPFCGTGTFVLAASKLGRKGYGCDIDEDILTIAEGRGCKWIR